MHLALLQELHRTCCARIWWLAGKGEAAHAASPLPQEQGDVLCKRELKRFIAKRPEKEDPSPLQQEPK